MSADRQGGAFPIRPINDEIKRARRENMPTGGSQSLLNVVCDELQSLLQFMSTGMSGKAQAVDRWIGEILSGPKRGLIVTSSPRDAKVLRRYLMERYHQHIVDKKIQVASVHGVHDVYGMEGMSTPCWSQQISGGQITGPRGEWRFIWVNYPIQHAYAERNHINFVSSRLVARKRKIGVVDL